jgi:3-hydroxyacyl-CoA dehydrogenase
MIDGLFERARHIPIWLLSLGNAVVTLGELEEKMARNELGPKTGRGFFDYTGDRREAFETEKVRALLRRLRLERQQ